MLTSGDWYKVAALMEHVISLHLILMKLSMQAFAWRYYL